MADWASLINAPPPSSNNPTICEMDGLLTTANDVRSQCKLTEILAQLPSVDLAIQDPKIGHKLQAADSTFWSAKSAFLARSESKISTSSNILNTNGVLENFLARNEETWWLRFLSSILNFGSRCKLSGDELISLYSNTRDLTTDSPVRCLAWHPHVAKLAIALKDDSVQVSSGQATKPLLKHKKQRQVACLAWRPFSASELAIGCSSGVLIWSVDPMSVVARPSAACVSLLSEDLKQHQPVTGLQWNPQGTLLLSCCASDNSMYIWNTASEVNVPLKRLGGGGVHLAAWSPSSPAVVAATTSSVFRIWNTTNWQPERWTIMSGFINNMCWSPCGTTMLFTTSEECQIYCLRVTLSEEGIQSAGAAVPVMDLSKVALDDEEQVTVGGQVLGMRWDPSGERLAVTFKESSLIALFCTRISANATSISPLGFVQGEPGEEPSCIEFAKHFRQGALLSVVWNSGRFQHFPMFFMPMSNVQLSQDNHPGLLSSSPATAVEFTPRIFSSPAM